MDPLRFSVPLSFARFLLPYPPDIEKRIVKLDGQRSARLRDVQENLRRILADLHEINKTQSIPYSWYHEENETTASLSRVVRNLSRQASGQDYIQLVELLIGHYFCGTNHLLFHVLTEAVKRYPELSGYVTYEGMDPRGEMCTPFLTPTGVHQLIVDFLAEQQVDGVVFPEVFYFEELERQVRDFYGSGALRGLFLVNFHRNLRGHMSPLILERRGELLSILNSDSVFMGPKIPYTLFLVNQMQSFSFPLVVYALAEPRQYDQYSCSVFAIQDVKEAVKIWKQDPEACFIDQIHESAVYQFQNRDVHEVRPIPERLLKAYQSLSRVRALGDLQFIGKKGSRSLQEYINQRSYYCHDPLYGTDEQRNMTASLKLATYFEHFLTKTVSLRGE